MRPSLTIAFAAVLLPATLLGSPQPRPTSRVDGRTSPPSEAWYRDITLTGLKP
jgi:hypothetical protein